MNLAYMISTYGFLGLFVMLCLEYLILVVPGETILTTVGMLSRSGTYHFSLITLILVTGLGTFAGSVIAYGIGRLFGRPILLKYGKYVFLTTKRLEQSETLFQKRVVLTLLVSKYIAVVRDIVPYIAGMNRVRLQLFIPLSLVSSFLWTATFIEAGGIVGRLWQSLHRHWRGELLPIVLIALSAGVAYWYIHKRLTKLMGHPVNTDTQGTSK
ncbi:DedA family protein [Alicyclobacillus dauci]|uniref:DedA family protein n=1 Tax=Alicyclobacillus dauci TaxID=1475485 RepID=A0ABY6YY84_9BACL|nr:DedA family protein [Alicyclobacillus dauci]WAH35248.1 DedA family protein [Alicyclobacillus dauci]